MEDLLKNFGEVPLPPYIDPQKYKAEVSYQTKFAEKPGAVAATLKATVTNGSVSAIEVVSSGSGYTFTPRITFKQPGGAVLGTCPIVGGQVSGTCLLYTSDAADE